jgi:hypothetical protein
VDRVSLHFQRPAQARPATFLDYFPQHSRELVMTNHTPPGDAGQPPASLTADQQARAADALDAWSERDRAAGVTCPWNQYELREMHAALEAPDTRAALLIVGADPGTPASTPEQDADNHATMSRIRQLLGRQADAAKASAEARPEAEVEL